MIKTTSNYKVEVTNSSVNAIVGDDGTVSSLDAASMVWGTLDRYVISGLASGSNTYIFPVGQTTIVQRSLNSIERIIP